MSERSGDSGGLSSGDPLGGGGAPEAPRHESGLPGYTSPAAARRRRPGRARPRAAADALGGRYVLASWWSRVGAQLIDGLIIGVGALILFLPIGAALGVGFADDSDAGVGRR